MKTRCDGCGIKIQTTDPSKEGYIKSEVYLKNPENFYCERCYNLIHYNKNLPITISDKVFNENVKKIHDKDILIVNVVDIFDLEGTVVPNINELFPNQDIILVANKFDLFLDSIKVTKVKNYLQEYLKANGIKVKSTIIISSLNNNDIARLITEIEKYQYGRDVYMFGYTNVGKSSIINKVTTFLKGKYPKITVSNAAGTTLDFIKVPLPNKTYIFDMPGIVNSHQLTHYLEAENLNLLSPKKYIKPKVFQLNPLQALFLGGVCKLLFTGGERASFVVYVPSNLVIHRTKLENSEHFYEEHKDDILMIPNPEEREKLGEMKSYNFKISNDEKVDITISGLGFVTIAGDVELTVEAFEKIRIGKRKAII